MLFLKRLKIKILREFNQRKHSAIFPAMAQQSNVARRGVIGVIVREGRLLVIRRSQTVIAPGLLCFPGGGIEAGESETAALVREMREELNVAVTPQRRLWTSITPWQISLAWWLTALDADAIPTPNPAEVASVHWHTPAEAAELPDLLPSNHDFLRALNRDEFSLR